MSEAEHRQHALGTNPARGRIAEVFDMEGILRAASPYQLHPVIVSTTDSVEVLAGNTAVERRLGFRSASLRGGTASRLFDSAAEFRRAASSIRRVLASGQTGWYGYFQMRRQNGERYNARLIVTFVRELRLDRVLAVIVIRDPDLPDRPDDSHSQYGIDLDAISSNLPGGLFQRVLDGKGNVQYAFLRGQVLDRLGIAPERVEEDAEVLLRRMHADDRWVFEHWLEESARTLKPVDIVLRYTSMDGEPLRVRTLSHPRQLDNDTILWDGIMLEVGEEYEATIRHQQLAYCDELTGLPNLAAFQILLESLMKEPRGAVIAAINLKRMGAVNQVLGVAGGNDLIRQVARRLSEQVGCADRIARTPTGDFLVCVEAGEPMEVVGERLLAVFDQPLAVLGGEGPVTSVGASIGLVRLGEHGDCVQELLLNIEMALNRARSAGRSRYQTYSRTLRNELQEEARLEQELRDAVESGAIEPYYQPQVDLHSGQIVGLEVLARWQRADGSFVSPAQFIPLAEKSGLISKLGKSIVSKVICNVKGWREARSVPRVFINVSGLHLCDGDFDAWYLDVLEHNGMEVDNIGLEVTESTFLLNLDEATECMNRLAAKGVKFSMDDFGTGYSSLSYLVNLPFHSIKIDRTFVDGLERSDKKNALVESIIRIGQRLGMKVIAEGVETAEQVAVLRALDCSAAQGYFFCRPVPADETEQWLELASRSTGD